ncbi:MAG: DEAD/DEAH box helicase [Bacteroidaceae bacterium]|nr:DEAD/DEAH box helicase [Bacteroidaceae bacterium]
MKFSDLNIDERILDAIDAMKYVDCTPIQEQAIPPLLEGRDLIGIAQTGTGKTAAYLLPILHKLCSENLPTDVINCIIMSPTRELAQQIDQAMEAFSYFVPFSSVAVYGGNDGVRYQQELRGMQLGADVIVATPGRLLSHIKLGNIDLSNVSFFVLDEADRMLDMGFYDDIMTIVSHLPKERQTLMFSATMPSEIRNMANSILKNPVEIKIAMTTPAEHIDQKAYICSENQKLGILKSLSENGQLNRSVIFASSKAKVKELFSTLHKVNSNIGEIHSDLDQKERDLVLRNFKNGQIDILIATDIIARGIDIDDIETVINYDVPHDVEDYVHRIGRTARANRKGTAITFVNEKDAQYFKRIKQKVGKKIVLQDLPNGMESTHSLQSEGEKKKNRPKNRNRRFYRGNKNKAKTKNSNSNPS